MKIKLFTIPNLITLLNLLCGSAAVATLIYVETAQALPIAFFLMLAAAVFDFFDGFAARLLKAYSPLGVQLDSLADMVSFSLLPALIAMKLYYFTGGSGAWGAATLLIVLFSALRLAKFNIDDSQSTEFEGLPTPANALFFGAAGYFLSTTTESFAPWMPWAIIAVSVLMAWLLISPVRMFSFKFHGFGWKGNQLRYCFLAFSAIVLIVTGFAGLAIIIPAYVVVSFVWWLARRGKKAA